MGNIKKIRIPYWDNIKGLLIILVVIGHLLETLPQGHLSIIYKLIYLFHMPLFIFVSGYLAKFNLKKSVKNFLVPYLIIQPVCCIVTGNPVTLTTPFWILWYLLSLFIWYLSIPLLDQLPTRKRPIFIVLCILFACIVGYKDSIGYFASLSRTIVFFPYFVMGYYTKYYYTKHKNDNFLNRNKYIVKVAVCGLVFLVIGAFIYKSSNIDAKWLYGAYSYTHANYTLLFRLLHYAIAITIGCFILIFIPQKKNILTEIGKNSFKIYLTHMIIVPAVKYLVLNIHATTFILEMLCIILGFLFCKGLVDCHNYMKKRFSMSF